MSVPAEPQWYVVIEENAGSGQGLRWNLMRNIPAASAEQADQLSREWARNYRPRHPASPKRRTIYRIGDTSWLVLLTGISGQTFPFRVSVAQWYGTYPD